MLDTLSAFTSVSYLGSRKLGLAQSSCSDGPIIAQQSNDHDAVAALAGPRRFPLSIPIDRPDDPTARDGARHFAALKGWTRPIHFIWGGQDRVFTPDWGRAWAGLYPQATFDLLPDAGHFPQETHGTQIADLVLGHVGAGAPLADLEGGTP